MHHPTDRIAHTTAFVTPVVEHWLEREIAQWVHPMKDRSDNPYQINMKITVRVIAQMYKHTFVRSIQTDVLIVMGTG